MCKGCGIEKNETPLKEIAEYIRNDPVLIVGAPRSGTSVTAAILEKLGVWLGPTSPGTNDNPKGFFENLHIRDSHKKILAQGGFDVRGVSPLPPLDWGGFPEALRANVAGVLRKQGCRPDQLWGFKDPKTTLIWRCWLSAFPKARFIVVRRSTEGIIRSCKRASFFRNRKVDWRSFVRDQIMRLNLIEQRTESVCVWPENLKHGSGWRDFRMAVERLGIAWKSGVEQIFENCLWDR